MSTTSPMTVRELDHRTNDRVDVRLLWDPATDQVLVAVEDERSGESLQFEVDPAEALGAFLHPYAYADYEHLAHSLAA